MKYYLFIPLILYCQFSFSQQDITIIKKYTFDGAVGFSPKDYISEKMEYNNHKIISRIYYSYNGWQIYDSIYYEYDSVGFCANIYQPKYINSTRIIERYDLGYKDCYKEQENDILKMKFNVIDDKFNLTEKYKSYLNFLLELKIKENTDEAELIKDGGAYFFEEGGVSPVFFMDKGIPHNELLYNFNFTIQDHLIKSDSFVFENYLVKRQYYYEQHFIKQIQTIIVRKKTNQIFVYNDYFEIVEN